MGSTTFSITPAAGSQANDAEDMINNDNNQTSITFPVDILITDVCAIGATTSALTSAKQFAFQVMASRPRVTSIQFWLTLRRMGV